MKNLDRCCKEKGRDPKEIRRSWHGFVRIAKEEQSIENTIRDLKAMADAGVQDFILGFDDRKDIAALRVFAENVLPVFK